MKIDVAKVRRSVAEVFHYDLKEAFPPLQIGTDLLTYKEPVHVQLQVSSTGKSLLVRGQIHACLNVECSRCLKKFTYPMDLPYEDEWVVAAQATEEQKEDDFVFAKDEIEIGERITEQIILALPMKFLCSEDCRGLCPKCGQDLNLQECSCPRDDIDPRFAKLAEWNMKE